MSEVPVVPLVRQHRGGDVRPGFNMWMFGAAETSGSRKHDGFPVFDSGSLAPLTLKLVRRAP